MSHWTSPSPLLSRPQPSIGLRRALPWRLLAKMLLFFPWTLAAMYLAGCQEPAPRVAESLHCPESRPAPCQCPAASDTTLALNTPIPQSVGLDASASTPGVLPLEREAADVALERMAVATPPEAADEASGDDASTHRVSLVDKMTGTGVTARLLEGASERFSSSVGKVWAWVKVRNLGEPTQIKMVWRHEGKKKASVDLDVGKSSRWRTWSRKRVGAQSIGQWTVDVLGPDGELLDSMHFEITPAQARTASNE